MNSIKMLEGRTRLLGPAFLIALAASPDHLLNDNTLFPTTNHGPEQ